MHTDTFCLSGVHMSTELQLLVANMYTNVVIFLDDDNSTVKKASSSLRNDLSALVRGNVMVYHSGGKDPKKHGFAELEEVIDRCTKNVVGSSPVVNALYAKPVTPW